MLRTVQHAPVWDCPFHPPPVSPIPVCLILTFSSTQSQFSVLAPLVCHFNLAFIMKSALNAHVNLQLIIISYLLSLNTKVDLDKDNSLYFPDLTF